MINRWGVDVKKGHWVRYQKPRGGMDEGRVSSVKREAGRGVVVTLDSGATCALDDVALSLGPMSLGSDGVVTQNPLVRVKVGSPPQRPKGKRGPPSKRLKARRIATEKAPRGVYANPISVQREAHEIAALVGGGSYWSVRFYMLKQKASGLPDIVYPASSEQRALAFVKELEKRGASGLCVVSHTKTKS